MEIELRGCLALDCTTHTSSIHNDFCDYHLQLAPLDLINDLSNAEYKYIADKTEEDLDAVCYALYHIVKWIAKDEEIILIGNENDLELLRNRLKI